MTYFTNTRQFVVFLVSMAYLLNALPAFSQQFRWGMQEGDTLDVVLEQSSNISTECNTIVVKSDISISLEMEWKILSGDDEKIEIQQTVNRVVLMMTLPRGKTTTTLNIDTNAEGRETGIEKEVKENLKSLIGARVKIKMSRLGKIEDVVVNEKINEAIRRSNSSTPLQQFLTPEGLHEAFSQSMFELPETKIAPGHNWTIEQEVAGPFGDQGLSHRYEFVGTKNIDDRPYEHFESKLSITTFQEPTAKTDDGDPPPELKFVSGKGEFLFDAKLGYFSDSSSESTVITKKTYRELVFDTKIVGNSKMKITKK